MATKSENERQLIAAKDHRRRYAARLNFTVLRPEYLAGLEDIPIELPDGTTATLRPQRKRSSVALGAPYALEVEAFATAALAEAAGLRGAQGLLLAMISLNVGVRLDYGSHEPASVYDRITASSFGFRLQGEGFASWSREIVLAELEAALALPVQDRSLVLSMELFASSQLGLQDQAAFVAAVSALEPLAQQDQLGPNVDAFVARVSADLEADASIPEQLRVSLKGRVQHLKRESVRQALMRLCDRWFPGDAATRKDIDNLYALRSQILHDGKLSDPDTDLKDATRRTSTYLRRIYAQQFGMQFRAPLTR